MCEGFCWVKHTGVCYIDMYFFSLGRKYVLLNNYCHLFPSLTHLIYMYIYNTIIGSIKMDNVSNHFCLCSPFLFCCVSSSRFMRVRLADGGESLPLVESFLFAYETEGGECNW
uniref:Uncharacterized protein n=1 Tax=Trypanosoma congolense (strain IL3000) TaxID=1068625 RepID=G0UZ97_TRYCI|nr:hypothetical protein, unlikely [Trypanosoma congolense IL3000]